MKEYTSGRVQKNTDDEVILSILVAADENNVIGKNNMLPWHLPNDLRYFKNLTWALPIVMGRKTFESIGKPLLGRNNIVITRNKDWKKVGVTIVHTIDDAIEEAKKFSVKEIFVIGGAEIFDSFFLKAGRIYLTRVHHQFEGDVFFSAVNRSEWELKNEHFCEADEKNIYAHTFQVWERK